ncbi:MFS transporter [Streptomyces hirsutus]|uniref:MFS transporter n=1 Tax=Streptomyces hirsutus TaxID=35620 RepID=UPI00343892A2
MSNVETPAKSAIAEQSEWRSGGRTAVTAAIGYGAGPVLFLTTASVFVAPTIEATGWSTREVLISPWLSGLFALCGPLVSRRLNRKGVRSTAVLGLLGFSALLVLFAVMPLNHLTFYGVAAGIGLFGSFAYAVTFNRAVANWFSKSAGTAFGLVGAGGAVMPLVAIPVVSYVIYTYGWRMGYIGLGAFALLVSLPNVLFGIKEPPLAHVRDEAKSRQRGERHAQPSVLRTARFWVLVLSCTVAMGGANGFLSNVQPILLDGGLTPVVATSITTLFTVGVIVGRLGAGALLDLTNKYAVAVSVLTISGLGALALTQVSVLPLIVVGAAALMVAFSQGAEGDIAAYFILDEYGKKDFATLFALAMAATAVGSIGVPFAFAWIIDSTGSYLGACILGTGCYLASAALLLVFRAMGRKNGRHDSGAENDAASALVTPAPTMPTENK